MNNYANEDIEAISRLHNPERPIPFPNLSYDSYPYDSNPSLYLRHTPHIRPPHKETNENKWDRIIKESRQSKLPKYSISQRFWINQPDLGKTVYEFDLDKTFVTAVGDRKSIAVRNISLCGPETRFDCVMRIVPSIWIEYNDRGSTKIGPKKFPTNSYIEGIFNTKEDILNFVAGTYSALFKEYDIDISNITINRNIVKFTVDLALAVINKHNVKNIGFSISPISDSYSLFNKKEIRIEATNKAELPGDSNKSTVTYDCGELISFFQFPRSVCSTINPYSQQNIIGSFNETHDMLNKIYPYDRQNNFLLWFNDAEGNRIENKNITGFIDLELIVDNNNNINLDV